MLKYIFFSYSWSDLKPVQPMPNVVTIFQLIGAGVGAWLNCFDDLFISFLHGGLFLTFPGVLFGNYVLHRSNPAAVTENKIIVAQLTVLSGVLTAMSIAIFVFRDQISA